MYIETKIKAGTIAGLIAGILISNVAIAQIEEITVTAQKRQESLQDVPIALTAFTADTMDALGVDDVSDLVGITPGLSARQHSGSNRSYFLRGVGTNDFHLTSAPAVGQYFDEITLTSGFLAKAALFDMERVEILKGPQNTLFGLNTTGGAVNYISRKPEIASGTTGEINLKVGNNSHVGVDAALGFDLGSSAAVRLAGYWSQTDGAFDSQFDGRDFGDDETQAFRGQLLWEPSDRTDILVNIHFASSENNGTAYKDLGTRSPDGSGAVCASFNPQAIPDFDNNTDCISRDAPSLTGGAGQPGVDTSFADWTDIGNSVGGEDLDTGGIYVKLNHAFNWGTLTLLGGFDNLDFETAIDLDGTVLGLMQAMQSDDRDTSQFELRLLSEGDGAFRWIGGLYYLDEDAESYTGLRSRQIGRWAILPNVQLFHTKENLGVYFQGEYDLSESLTATAGVRVSDEEINGDYLPSAPVVVGTADTDVFFRSDINALVANQGGFDPARQVSQILENDDVGFSLKLDYRFGDDSMIYGSFSRGFKGGALDIRAAYALVPVANVIAGLEDARLEPESLDAWELGYKGTFLDNQLQLDAAVFLYKYENLQQFVTVRGVPTLDNAPESEINGFDANLKYANSNGFYGQFGVSVLDSEVTEATESGFVQGAPLASSPELSFSILAAQDFEFDNGLLTLTANINYTDDQASETLTAGTQPVEGAFTVDSYTIVNANATYRFGSEQQFAFSVYGNNLTDENYCHGIRASDNANLARDAALFAGPPPAGAFGGHHLNVTCAVSNATTRTYGASFSYEF